MYVKAQRHVKREESETKLLRLLFPITHHMTHAPSILASIHSFIHPSLVDLWPSPGYIPLLPAR